MKFFVFWISLIFSVFGQNYYLFSPQKLVWEKEPDFEEVFYKGYNLGGNSIKIGANQWEGSNNNNSISITNGTSYTYTNFVFTPNVDFVTSEMLRSFYFGQLDIVINISNDKYKLYLWTFEDNNPINAAFNVEGVSSNYISGLQGKWDKLGFEIQVNDSKIDISLRVVGDLGQICGIEIYKIAKLTGFEVVIANTNVANIGNLNNTNILKTLKLTNNVNEIFMADLTSGRTTNNTYNLFLRKNTTAGDSDWISTNINFVFPPKPVKNVEFSRP